MTKHAIEIAQQPSGQYRVELDGTDIANALSGLTVDMTNPGYPPAVTLHLPVHIQLSTAAEVVVDERSHTALVHLGWTPPPAT